MVSPAEAAELFREHGAPVHCAAETRTCHVTVNATHMTGSICFFSKTSRYIVSAVHFHPRLDEKQLSAAQF